MKSTLSTCFFSLVSLSLLACGTMPGTTSDARNESAVSETSSTDGTLPPADESIPDAVNPSDAPPPSDLQTPPDTPIAPVDAPADQVMIDVQPPRDVPVSMDVPAADRVSPPDVVVLPDAPVTDVPMPPTDAPVAMGRCRAVMGGGTMVAAPTISTRFRDDGGESWLASPAVADLDNDGRRELIVARGGRVYAWRADGTRMFTYNTTKDRIWASPVVADLTGDRNLEVAVAARDSVYITDLRGMAVTGFPQVWGSETRSFAAGDLDGDGRPELIAGVRVRSGTFTDVVRAYRTDGTTVMGFPPNQSGTSGCAMTNCYPAGLYDQNLAIGDLDNDRRADIVAPHDNAYASFFRSSGVAFDSHAMFRNTRKTPGVRYLHDYAEARQGYSNNEATGLQAHFTNTAPAIADIDGDGTRDVVMLGSVQNAAQSRRELGVGLWALRSDASRLAGWDTPFHVPAYVAGLWDGFAPTIDGAAVSGAGNLVGATNQVALADIDATARGLEIVFAGFDGRIHAVTSDRRELWSTAFATDGRALTGGVAIGDLSGDGVPEIVFATYSYVMNNGALYVLDARGNQLHRIALSGRGAMAVPTLADLDGDGLVEIFVSLKDAAAMNDSTLMFRVSTARGDCLPWPTGRGNNLRNATVD